METQPHWLWLYNQESGELSVKLSEENSCQIAYKPSQLVNIHFERSELDIEDATVFQSTTELLEGYPSDKLPCAIGDAALHAMAWKRFGRPQMPQSWYFQKSDITEWPEERRLCELNSGFDQGLFMIIDADDEFASCVLLDESMQLSAIKTMRQFQVIKVTLNRLLPATIDLAMSSQSSWGQRLA